MKNISLVHHESRVVLLKTCSNWEGTDCNSFSNLNPMTYIRSLRRALTWRGPSRRYFSTDTYFHTTVVCRVGLTQNTEGRWCPVATQRRFHDVYSHTFSHSVYQSLPETSETTDMYFPLQELYRQLIEKGKRGETYFSLPRVDRWYRHFY